MPEKTSINGETLMDWKTRYCLKVKSLQIWSTSSLQLQSKSKQEFFFFQVDKLASKTFIWKGKGTSIVKTILQKNEFGMSLLDFKAYYRAAVTIECGIGKRIGLRIDGTEESRNGPTQYDHLITTKNKDNSLCIFGYPYAKNWTWPTHYTQKLTKAES